MTEMKETQKKQRKFSRTDNMACILIAGFLLILVGGIVGDLLVSLVSMLIPALSASDAWITFKHYISFLGIWMVTLLIIARVPRNRPILKALGTKTKVNTLKMFAAGLAIGLGMNLLCALTALVNGDIVLTFHSFRPVSFLLLFVAVLVQSAAEELICRVFIYQRLVRRYGKPLLAVLANAIFFSLIHIFNPGLTFLAMLNILLSGLLFSVMVVYMDSPWAAMAAHASWNFCQNILLGLPNSGNVVPYSVFKLDAAAATDSFAYSVSFGLEGTLTACAVLFITTGLIVWWGTRNKIVPTDIWAAEV
jgi:membrane protease YdiL (CAAX protease family)